MYSMSKDVSWAAQTINTGLGPLGIKVTPYFLSQPGKVSPEKVRWATGLWQLAKEYDNFGRAKPPDNFSEEGM